MDEEALKLLAAKIRLKRIEMGYSQDYMANQLKISQNVYSQNERHIGNVPFNRVLQIFSILNISIAKLIEL